MMNKIFISGSMRIKRIDKRVDPLAETMAVNLKSAFQTASFVIPIPPSKNRTIQPAVELARKVSEKMKLPFFENILLKKGTTPQMKDISTTKERIDSLMGCFHINDETMVHGMFL